MDETVKARLQRIRLRKLNCQRHIRVLSQKLASNPRDPWARRELERMEELLASLEKQEKRLLGDKGEKVEGSVGGEKNDDESESPDSG